MDDLEFVYQFVKGESQARDQFIKRYSRLIYKYIQHVLQVRGFRDPSAHVDDIFQGFIVFLIDEDCKRLKAFKAKNGATLATWIRYLTINFTRDYLRKVRPAISLDAEGDDNLALKDLLTDKTPLANEELLNEEGFRALEDCVDLLSEDERYFVELNFNQKVSLEIMRDFLKLTRGAIDMQKARLMRRLKDCFKGKGFELDF
jgi:RNA polymerase sigma factor (sigma-70 family)